MVMTMKALAAICWTAFKSPRDERSAGFVLTNARTSTQGLGKEVAGVQEGNQAHGKFAGGSLGQEG